MIWGLEKIFNFMKLRILHIAPWRVSMSLQFLQYFSFSCWQFFSTGQIFSQEIQSLDIMLRSCASSRYNYTNRSLVDKADWVDLASGSDQILISTSISSCFPKSLKQSACVGVEGVRNWPPLLISVLRGPSWCLLLLTIDSSKMQSAVGNQTFWLRSEIELLQIDHPIWRFGRGQIGYPEISALCFVNLCIDARVCDGHLYDNCLDP